MNQNKSFFFAGGKINSYYLFAFFWLVVFVIYFPAAKAGFIGDVPYDINAMKTESLFQYLNIKINVSLYQSALLQALLLYKLFGVNAWLWHIVYTTLHACNAFLLFKVSHRLLQDSKLTNAASIAFITAVLFAVCPYASEPVVWKACNHYLVNTLSIFLIIFYVQKFYTVQKIWYAWLTGILFFNASFSLEIFYLVPVFVLILIWHYRFVLHYDKSVSQKALLYFFIPILSIFLFHLLLLRIIRHTFFAHFGSLAQTPLSISIYLYKPLKYLFHVIFLGRYFPLQIRQHIYILCENKKVILFFYSLVICFFGYVLLRFKKVRMKLKVMALILIYILLTYGLVSPLSFPDSGLVFYDRYTYLSTGFDYLFLILLVSFISFRIVKAMLLTGYIALNIWFAVKVNLCWKQSAMVIDHLLNNFPDPGKKTVLLLNLPDDLNGVPMIAATEDGRFHTMLEAFTDHSPKNEIYDVVAYNMSDVRDGAHIKVLNDSVVDVTLNQWGTWWLYGMLGAASYSTKDYSVSMVDEGHWYELTLKHPAEQYLLLFEVGDKWKIADWNKKNVDQY